MASNFSEAFVRGYSNAVKLLVSTQGNKFLGKTREESQIGELEFYETLGSIFAQEAASGNTADTPLMDPDHGKRVCAQQDYDVATLITKQDAVKALVNFDSVYSIRIAQALNRKRDIGTIKGALGTAATGKLATGSAAFDFANQTIPVATGGTGATGMNVAKMKAIKAKFLIAGYDESEELYVALTGEQVSDLLNDSEFISYDFNAGRPLEDGVVNKFVGINIVQTQQLPFILNAGGVNLNWDGTDKPIDVDANKTRACFAWVKDALLVGTNPELTVDVSIRNDKRNATQAYGMLASGAVRMEEPGIQLCPCLEVL